MSEAVEPSCKIDIAHVLAMDVVAYSTLLITQQTQLMAELTRVVKSAASFQRAETAGKLLCIPTGDGMLLVFADDPQAPIECATEIATALKNHSGIAVRMGIHSGPINRVVDVNERANVAGAGIDLAQRVMDCGDAGHILLSKRAAEDLAPFPRWNPHLHELGECEVKHGRKVSLVNFFTDVVGNAARPRKCLTTRARSTTKISWSAAGLALALFVIVGWLWSLGTPSHRNQVKALPQKSIAVLPFENLSADPNNAYFADGIQEEILTRLSKIADLKVISRTSTQRYKTGAANLAEIAKQLGVVNILEGSVQKSGDQVRVSVQLIDGRNDSHLWAEKFDRKSTDVFAVETDVATKVGEILQAKLRAAEANALAAKPTGNSDAHELYLRGRYEWNKRTPEGINKAIEYFQNAIAIDPTYAEAYAGEADCYAVLQLNSDARPDEVMPKAKAAALAALKIDNSLAQGHAALASVKAYYDWDWTGAEEEMREAIDLDPNDARAHHGYATFLSAQGRNAEAITQIKRAQELDPLSLIIGTAYAVCLYHARDYEAAIAQCQKVFEIDPNFWVARYFLGAIYEQQGRHEQALAEMMRARTSPNVSAEPLAAISYVHAVSGRIAEAKNDLHELEQLSAKHYVPPYHFAMAYAGLKEKDRAFDFLEQSFRNRDEVLGFALKSEPRWDLLRSDPRYVDLLRRMRRDRPQH